MKRGKTGTAMGLVKMPRNPKAKAELAKRRKSRRQKVARKRGLILQLHQEGLSPAAISDKVGISTFNVDAILKQQGKA